MNTETKSSKAPIRYIHLFNKELPRGGATIAYDREKHEAGIAVCCEKDPFSRPHGRMLAKKQLLAGRVTTPDAHSRKSQERRFARKLIFSGHNPRMNLRTVAQHLIIASDACANGALYNLASDWLDVIETRIIAEAAE